MTRAVRVLRGAIDATRLATAAVIMVMNGTLVLAGEHQTHIDHAWTAGRGLAREVDGPVTALRQVPASVRAVLTCRCTTPSHHPAA